jgi:integral membrane protein (TIGR00529 family)
MPDALVSLSPLLRLLTVFALMLLGMRLRLGLGLSVLAGSFILACWCGMSPLQWAAASAEIFEDRATLLVCAVLALILALASLMESTGQVDRFMKALSRHIKSPKIRLVFFPILIGLLPMPGGAVFSAPLIQAVTRGMPVPELDKSLVNYWFRHTAEMSWPLFPSVILAASISGIPTPRLVFYTCPLVLGFFAAGWFGLMRGLCFSSTGEAEGPEEDASWGDVLFRGLPIFLSLAGALLLEWLIAIFLPGTPVDYGVPAALAAGILICLRQNALPFGAFARAASRGHVIGMILMVGALGIFKIILEKSGSVEELMHMGNAGTALLLAAVGMPLLVGFVTGLLMACVGITMPLLIALVPAGEGALPWITLSLVSGFVGTMSSPLHICFVLSCRYFRVDAASAWKRLPLPVLLFGLSGIAYFLLTR